ncbi:sugar phosphate isomerase/epimerase family protein [Arthrobacter pigmenti]
MTDDAVRWTLSGFGDEIDPDPAVQSAVLLALGAKHIEVRSAFGVNVADMDDGMTARLKDTLDGAGLRVSAVASPVGKVDVATPPEDEVARLRHVIGVAKRLETQYIRVFSFFRGEGRAPQDIRDGVLTRMSLLAAEAQRAGVVLVHENEKDIYGDTPDRVLDIIESVGSPALKVAWDSANFVQVGVKPFDDAYDILRPHLEYLQLKDAVMSSGEVVPSGEGDGQLLTTLTALRDDDYAGFASLEPHLASAHALGGFSGPTAFGEAARAFRGLTDGIGVELA